MLGAGAVGCYFGGMLARANQDVTFIARLERAKALNEYGLDMDCIRNRINLVPLVRGGLACQC